MSLRYGWTLALALIPFLSSCSKTPGTPENPTAPRLLVDWGDVVTSAGVSGSSDLFLVPDGRTLLAAPTQAASPILRRIDLVSGQVDEVLIRPGENSAVTAVTGTLDGSRVGVILGASRRVVLLDAYLRILETWYVPEDPAHPDVPLEDIAFNSVSGELVIADASGPRLVRYRLDGTLLGRHQWPILAGTPSDPRLRITVLPGGDMLVGRRELHRFAPMAFRIGSWPIGTVAFEAPVVAIDREGTVHVVERQGGAVRRYRQDGFPLAPVESLSSMTLAAGVGDLTFTRDGALLVADALYPAVFEYGKTRDFLRSHILEPPASQAVGSPADLVLTADGEVIAADLAIRHLVRTSASGRLLAAWGSPGTTQRPLVEPNSIASLPGENVMVVDRFLGELRTYSGAGQLLHVDRVPPSTRVAATSQFVYRMESDRRGWMRPVSADPASPWTPFEAQTGRGLPLQSLATDEAGNLYLLSIAADGQTPRIFSVYPNGTYRRQLQRRNVPPEQGRVLDIAVDDAGWLYTAESSGFFSAFDDEGRLRARWRDICDACPPGNISIAVGGDRTLYTAREGQAYQRFAAVH